MSSAKAKSLSRSKLWAKVFAADYPMVELYRLLPADDKARRSLALKIVRDPANVAEAFGQTVAAMRSYVSPYGFHESEPTEPVADGSASADLHTPLARRPRTTVDTSSLVGVTPGELDVVFLDREVSLTRTTQAHREAGVVAPGVDLTADLLLAAPDGTIGIGEFEIGGGRDLFTALIQVLAGVSLVASPAQIGRVLANYAMPVSALAPGPAPKVDAVLISVPQASPDGLLTQLDVLARGFAPALLQEPQIGGIVRQIISLRADLRGDDVQLTANWVERS